MMSISRFSMPVLVIKEVLKGGGIARLDHLQDLVRVLWKK